MRFVLGVALLSGFCLAACGRSGAHSDGAAVGGSGGGVAGSAIDGGFGRRRRRGRRACRHHRVSRRRGCRAWRNERIGRRRWNRWRGNGRARRRRRRGGCRAWWHERLSRRRARLRLEAIVERRRHDGRRGRGGRSIRVVHRVAPEELCLVEPADGAPRERRRAVGAKDERVPSLRRRQADYAVAIWLEDGHNRRQIVRSPDLGASWCLIPTAASISEVIPAPASASALYALTIPSTAGTTDVLRSRDGGATWATARGGLPEANDTNAASLQVAANPDVVWLQGKNALHLSRNGADSWSTVAFPKPSDPDAMINSNVTVDKAMPQRLLFSGLRPPFSAVPLLPFIVTSTDWGVTWTERNLPTPTNPEKLRGLQIEIDQASTLYVGLDTSDGLSASYAVWRSTSWGGAWTSMPGTGGAVPMTLGSNVPGVLFEYRSDGTYRSVDAGATWNPITYPENAGALVAVSPDKLIAKTPISIANSTDGGASWKELPIVPDQINPVIASPVAPYPLWGAAQAGGVWAVRSDDGASWTATGANWPVFPDGASADVAYASGIGATGLVQTADRGRTWQVLPTPTGGAATLVATCPPPRSCVYVTQSTGSATSVMSRSDDCGRSWRAPTAVTNWGLLSPIVISPDDSDVMLQGRDGGIYQSRDGGGTWTYQSLMPAKFVGIVFLSGSEVVAVTDQRQLMRSSNGGDDWTIISPNPMPAGYTRGIVRSVTRPGTLFVLTGGNPDPPLYRSDDGGATWKAQSPLGDGVMDVYGAPFVTSIAETACGFLGGVQASGLVNFD